MQPDEALILLVVPRPQDFVELILDLHLTTDLLLQQPDFYALLMCFLVEDFFKPTQKLAQLKGLHLRSV